MKKQLLFIPLFFAFSCTKTIEIDLPAHDPKSVINCLFTPDSLFKLRLSQSVSIFDSLPPVIEDAKIMLYEEEVLKDTLFFNGKEYESHIMPEANKNYRVEVTTPGLGTVYAEDYIPAAANLLSASLIDSVYADEEGLFFSRATIRIKDNSSARNHYELVLLKRSLSYNLTDTTDYQSYYDEYNNPIFETGSFFYCNSSSIVFTDELFNGEEYEFVVNYDSGDYLALVVILRAVSKDYYDYKKTLSDHSYSQDDDIWYGVGGRVQMVSNIYGGYGIFAGYSGKMLVIQR